MKVRGQVTMFFALGLVILIAVAILSVLVLRVRSAENPSLDLSGQQVLTNYVANCVDTAVNEELIALGSTGGMSLFAGGGYPYGTVHTGEDTAVLFGITQNRRQIGDLIPEVGAEDRNIDFSHITMYCPMSHSFPDDECVPLSPFLDGYFGEVNFPPLCDKNGPNGIGSTVLCPSYPGSPVRSIPAIGAVSVQQALSDAVRTRVSSCISPQQFRQTTGYDLTAGSAPNVSIMFTDRNILVELAYNLSVTGRAQSALFAVDRRYDVRLMPLLAYATALAREDTRNVSFSVGERAEYSDRRRLPYEEGFSVTKRTLTSSELVSVSPSSLFERADLVTITDERSLVRGLPFSFQFLVEHRPPMLEALQGRSCGPEYGRDPDDGPITMISDPGRPECQIKDDDGFTDSETP